MNTKLIAPVALIGMTLLAGCGKSDNQSQAPSAGTTASPAAPATSMPAPKTEVPETTGSTGN